MGRRLRPKCNESAWRAYIKRSLTFPSWNTFDPRPVFHIETGEVQKLSAGVVSFLWRPGGLWSSCGTRWICPTVPKCAINLQSICVIFIFELWLLNDSFLYITILGGSFCDVMSNDFHLLVPRNSHKSEKGQNIKIFMIEDTKNSLSETSFGQRLAFPVKK